MLTWGKKNVAILKLKPQPKMKKACTCFDEEDAQNKENHKKKKKEKKEKEEKKGSRSVKRSSPLLIDLIRGQKRLKVGARRSPQTKSQKVRVTLEKKEEENDVSFPVVEASISKKENSYQIKELAAKGKMSFEETKNTGEKKLSEDHSQGAQNKE